MSLLGLLVCTCDWLFTCDFFLDIHLWLLLGLSFHWPHIVRLCHQVRHILGRLRHLVLRCKKLQMRLGFSVNNTISCNYLVPSWFRTQTINNAGYQCLPAEYWYITCWPTLRSWVGKVACLSEFLTISGCIPSCFLAVFDIGKSDLAFLPWRVCISDCELPVIGVLW